MLQEMEAGCDPLIERPIGEDCIIRDEETDIISERCFYRP